MNPSVATLLEQLDDLTQAMGEAAEVGDWDRLARIETQRSRLLRRLPQPLADWSASRLEQLNRTVEAARDTGAADLRSNH